MNIRVFRYCALLSLLFSVAAVADTTSFVTASSSYDDSFLPEYAVDGKMQTRWASKGSGPVEWLQIDFGERVAIHSLRINWEAAYAADYEVQVSNNGADWTTIYHQAAGVGGEERLDGLAGNGQFLRIFCHRSGPFAVYSIWEISFPDEGCAEALERARARTLAAHLDATREARERLRRNLKDAGVDEIVYATRPLYGDGHWYANISYYSQDVNAKAYAKSGGLYKLVIASGASPVLTGAQSPNPVIASGAKQSPEHEQEAISEQGGLLRSARNDAVGEVIPLIEDAEGTVRDPAVHYDGRTILFSWRKGGTDSFHLYTINADGTNLTQLTFGEYDDIEPAWLPDGGMVFVSSRCRRWVNCWLTQVAIAHRCDADGKNIVPISANLEQDNTPWPMPDGRILYTRWEYVDRSQVDYHHLWTMNPDGTSQMVFFGNMHPGGVFIDAKPVPGTDDIVFINSPGHGECEHAGRVALLNVKRGPDDLPSIRNISGDGYRDPYPIVGPISKSDPFGKSDLEIGPTVSFLVAQGKNMILMDAAGTQEVLFSLPKDSALELHEPRPVVVRAREPLIPSHVDYAKDTGKLILTDVRLGRNMAGVAPGEIKKLLVLESLPKPVNFTGGMDPLTYGGSFTLERVLGTVPVEDDGSAYMELPANRALFFVALDEHNCSVKRMQSFCSVMPGEVTSCAGCHEARTTSGPLRETQSLKALARAASTIEPIAGIPDVFDFPRDIQPILDKHCVPCHDYEAHPSSSPLPQADRLRASSGDGDATSGLASGRNELPGMGPRAGGIILTGDHGPMYSHSYVYLTVYHQFADGRDLYVSNRPPRSIGASASPLMKKLEGGHHDVHLSDREVDMIRYWIESGAPYPGTYGALGCGSIGGYFSNTPMEHDNEWPASKAAAEAIQNRCAGCHKNEHVLPRNLSDEDGLSFWRPEWQDPRLVRCRHIVFNLSRPEFSLILLAPLAKNAGGYGLCKDDAGNESLIFGDKSDPDYRKLLAMCEAGKQRLETIKRFDMPGFRPPEAYIREMKRYKVLPADFAPDTAINPYETDRIYWQSFEQKVALKHPAYEFSD